MPFITWGWTVMPDAIWKVTPKSIDTQSKRLATNDDTTLSQEIFNIRLTLGEPVIRPDRLGNHLARITETYQARQISWNVHRVRLALIPISNNLAIPTVQIGPLAPNLDVSRPCASDRTLASL